MVSASSAAAAAVVQEWALSIHGDRQAPLMETGAS